jgi:hypothetical protein
MENCAPDGYQLGDLRRPPCGVWDGFILVMNAITNQIERLLSGVEKYLYAEVYEQIP